jgi:glutathione S-transferase
MNTLHFTPGSCSVGIRIVLEEIGEPYETVATDLRGGEQHSPAYKAISPKSKVPALRRADGSVLTEFPAIAWWLARSHPQAKLIPADAEGEARALEAMDYVVATIHMQGFARMARPGNFCPNVAEHPAVIARGREIFANGLAVMDTALTGRDYVTGAFSLADAALFYVEFWAVTRAGLTLPPNCAAHYERMLGRPSVRAVMEKEGLTAHP